MSGLNIDKESVSSVKGYPFATENTNPFATLPLPHRYFSNNSVNSPR
jgi:hypothetical protein